MNNRYLWIGIAVVVVLIGGMFLLNKGGSTTNVPTQNTTTVNETANEPVADTSENQVAVTAEGFSPNTITINTGDRVVWKNESGTAVTVHSDSHPTHLLWPFLNLGSFDDGSTVSVAFDKLGTYTYHNHFNSSQKGTVIVK